MKNLIPLLLAISTVNTYAQAIAPASGSQSARTTQATAISKTEVQVTQNQTADQIALQVWGLTPEELLRAKALLQGPRASFSVPNLSPVEALGIHARSEAERRKYAEKFAKAQHDDTERVLAWAMAYQVAMQRLYPNEKVIDFSNMPPASAAIGSADAANVPRSAVRQGKFGDGGRR